MTELRRRMIEDLQLRGMSERTQEMYVRAVRRLTSTLSHLTRADHRGRTAPVLPPSEECQEVLAQCDDHCPLRHQVFLRASLKRPWTTLTFVRPPGRKNFPLS